MENKQNLGSLSHLPLFLPITHTLSLSLSFSLSLSQFLLLKKKRRKNTKLISTLWVCSHGPRPPSWEFLSSSCLSHHSFCNFFFYSRQVKDLFSNKFSFFNFHYSFFYNYLLSLISSAQDKWKKSGWRKIVLHQSLKREEIAFLKSI